MSGQQKDNGDKILERIMNEEIVKFLKEYQKEIVKRAAQRLKKEAK